MQGVIYDQKGKEASKITLPEKVFGVRWNSDLVHQVVVSMASNKRRGTAHAKTRGEVSGGGKKPWRQKGTGRARHGSIRSPLWIGGGVTFGPRKDKNYERKINKKMRRKALFTALSKKLKDGEVLFLSDISVQEPKTKYAKEVLFDLSKLSGFEKLSYKKGKRALIVSPEKRSDLERIFRNIESVSFDELRNMNPLLVLTYHYIIILSPEKSLTLLSSRA